MKSRMENFLGVAGRSVRLSAIALVFAVFFGLPIVMIALGHNDGLGIPAGNTTFFGSAIASA